MERANVPLKVSPAGMFTLSNAAFTNVTDVYEKKYIQYNIYVYFSANPKGILIFRSFAANGS